MYNRLMSINYCTGANSQSHDANKEGQAGQNLFETNSQNYEAVYMEYNDEPATMFTAAFTLPGFCELSFM